MERVEALQPFDTVLRVQTPCRALLRTTRRAATALLPLDQAGKVLLDLAPVDHPVPVDVHTREPQVQSL